MDLSIDFTYWVFQLKVWLILGFGLIIIDIVLATFFLLPIGIAAFLVGGLILVQNQLWFGDVVFFETWHDIMIYFAVLSVVSIGIIRVIFQKRRKNTADINEY